VPAQIYGSESCPWTGRARALLEREGVAVDYIDLDASEHRGCVSRLVLETKQNTNPYIFLRGHFIGGFKALDEIQRLGQLTSYLETAEERARKASRIRIEIASRNDHDERPPGER
jgi:glutaredoxin